MIPRDVVDKLKRIEKLAKHLRGKINPLITNGGPLKSLRYVLVEILC